MQIDFCGPTIIASDGSVSHRARIDGKIIAIRISEEALQDVNPPHALDDPISQFEANSDRLLSIAENKICNGLVEGEVVWVRTGDL